MAVSTVTIETKKTTITLTNKNGMFELKLQSTANPPKWVSTTRLDNALANARLHANFHMDMEQYNYWVMSNFERIFPASIAE